MLRSINRKPFLSGMFFCMLLIMSACTTETVTESTQDPHIMEAPLSFESSGKAIYSPAKISFLIDNPLEFITIDESTSNDHQRFYVQIEGLLDETIQMQINAAIQELYNQYLPYVEGNRLLPYRGFATVYDESNRTTYSNLNITQQFNANSILSVSLFASGHFNNATGQSYYWSLSDGLTFDLNTGNHLTIADIFTSDADVDTIVSGAILEDLKQRNLKYPFDYFDSINVTLISPFKGILPSQKFYLTDGALVAIVDHMMPEFNTDFHSVSVNLPITHAIDYFAVAERFYEPDVQIFYEEPFEKHFIMLNYYDYLDQIMIQEYVQEDWHLSKRYPSTLPQRILDVLDETLRHHTQRLTELLEAYDERYVEQNIYVQQMGPYYQLIHSNFYNVLSSGGWDEHWKMVDEAGNTISLESLFHEGFDYKGMILEALESEILQYSGITPSNAPSPEFFWDDLQFSIGAREINFATQSHPWQKYYNTYDNSAHPLHFRIYFTEFGYDNLTFFD